MSITMTVDQRGLHNAMARYAALKNKSDADVVNKAMRFWLPFAGKKVRQVTPGEAKLRSKLKSPYRAGARTRKRKQPGTQTATPMVGSKNHPLRNTLVAAILAGRLVKKHGSLAASGMSAADFYEKASNLLEAKVNSAHYLRAGFIPAYRQFGIPRLAVSGHTRFKGRSKGIKAVPSIRGMVTAYATNQREGAFKIAPNAFTSSIPEVRAQFLKWLEQDINANARRTGF